MLETTCLGKQLREYRQVDAGSRHMEQVGIRRLVMGRLLWGLGGLVFMMGGPCEGITGPGLAVDRRLYIWGLQLEQRTPGQRTTGYPNSCS